MEEITSATQAERDYEIILDKISRLSFREDLPIDNPIIEKRVHYYLISNQIVTKTKEIIVS